MFRPVSRKPKNANGDVPLRCAADTGQGTVVAGNVCALVQLRAEAESGRYSGRAEYCLHGVLSQLRSAGQQSCAVNDVTPSS